jgi:hypothetical protein
MFLAARHVQRHRREANLDWKLRMPMTAAMLSRSAAMRGVLRWNRRGRPISRLRESMDSAHRRDQQSRNESPVHEKVLLR